MDGSKATFGETERFEQPVFSAVIRPHRSLSPQGFRIVMVLVCLTSVVASVPFLILGFWPVAGFFGLDFLGLYIAFRVSYRQGEAFELLELTPIRLLFRKVSPRGEVRDWQFNPLWTRLDREVDEEYGMQSLALASRNEHVVIARDLSPPERETLAEALGRALADVKRGY
ncbi:DUF2244 domain-containing protein [Microvirga arsenatis]|uniref:DUF2244 domain-containing protein n=1 Tax=Microvirga arsenatis TaxID=2692265 RepID=A0ABW9YZS3_9HYPH|nr:DUF2244 domain-containing protein [Microvirga arsenatis]NBJ11704.1 DUF2244 domain-containing protein [Microvirga arsenatis]NBJ24985.1 DUF2244 domain-containing protein [Microvirga arsenatis]